MPYQLPDDSVRVAVRVIQCKDSDLEFLQLSGKCFIFLITIMEEKKYSSGLPGLQIVSPAWVGVYRNNILQDLLLQNLFAQSKLHHVLQLSLQITKESDLPGWYTDST